MKEVFVNNLDEVIPEENEDIIYFKSTYQPIGLPAYDGNYWFGFTIRSGEPNFLLQLHSV